MRGNARACRGNAAPQMTAMLSDQTVHCHCMLDHSTGAHPSLDQSSIATVSLSSGCPRAAKLSCVIRTIPFSISRGRPPRLVVPECTPHRWTSTMPPALPTIYSMLAQGVILLRDSLIRLGGCAGGGDYVVGKRALRHGARDMLNTPAVQLLVRPHLSAPSRIVICRCLVSLITTAYYNARCL